jgi:hypothetical protein
MTDEKPANIYVNPKAPAGLRPFLREIFPEARNMSESEMVELIRRRVFIAPLEPHCSADEE